MQDINIVGAGSDGAVRVCYLVLGRGGLAGFEREHLHLLLEGQLLRDGRRRGARLLLRQAARARVSATSHRYFISEHYAHSDVTVTASTS